MLSALRSFFKMLAGIIIFAGLPLAGWGVRDLHGFADHPARLGYIVLVILLQAVVVTVFPETGRGAAGGRNTVRRQRLALLLLQIIPLAIVIFAPWSDRRNIAAFPGMEMLRYLGLGLFPLGFLIMLRAESALGKLFSVEVTVQEGHRLVTGGPYRYLRHPRYLGIILFTLGISLVFRSWLALALVAALTLVLLWRIHDEETLMHQEFGAEWERYSRKTRRLVPFVY